jgi:hypothetical protein
VLLYRELLANDRATKLCWDQRTAPCSVAESARARLIRLRLLGLYMAYSPEAKALFLPAARIVPVRRGQGSTTVLSQILGVSHLLHETLLGMRSVMCLAKR